ncbi:Uncharacterised protein [Enterobacter asburiae]|uniref:Uncharacterized protein n=1 Tax=Enterobacter asburiae TaxID=61645 RepID=A0A376FD69_ENTAS|nr:Uncharacterised protein [Enterobacter asburiae]
MDEFKPEDELNPIPAIVVLVVLVNLQNVITSRRSTLTMLIWMQTIVALRAAVTRTKSEQKRIMSPKKIQWTNSL